MISKILDILEKDKKQCLDDNLLIATSHISTGTFEVKDFSLSSL